MYELELSKAERRKLRKLFKDMCSKLISRSKLSGYTEIKPKRYTCVIGYKGYDFAQIVLDYRWEHKLYLMIDIERPNLKDFSDLIKPIITRNRELETLKLVDLGRISVDADEIGRELGLNEGNYTLYPQRQGKLVLSMTGDYDSAEKVSEVLQKLANQDLFRYVYDKSRFKELLLRRLEDIHKKLEKDSEILAEIIREIS
ncbi:MAG: hypothetical protein DRP01_00615 [Archaeoglobales archaeon]|nr:MAG: hypothetical protein DRP01_00615 [Archaeoglobales archaeon]